MADSKLLLWDTAAYLRTFDVVLLTETRCVALPPGLLPDHTILDVPASAEGRAGEGLLLAVRRQLRVSVRDWASDADSLWVRLAVPGAPRPLLVGVTYLPPAGSPQLLHTPLLERFDALEERVIAAAVEGHVFLAGDFNARVAGQPADASNLHGRSLVRLAQRQDLLLCTGRAPGDEAASATYSRAGAAVSRCVSPMCWSARRAFHGWLFLLWTISGATPIISQSLPCCVSPPWWCSAFRAAARR